MTVSRVFKKEKLPALLRPVQSQMNERHEANRLAFAQRFHEKSPFWWERVFISDEKNWVLTARANRQNQRVRAKAVKDVEPIPVEKFSESKMCWGGLTAKGLSRLRWIDSDTTVNGPSYRKLIAEEIDEM